MTGDYADVERFVRDHLCRQCWQPLIILAAPDRQYKVVCSACGEGERFVSKAYVERRRADDRRDYVDARVNLVKSIESKEKIITDLFGG